MHFQLFPPLNNMELTSDSDLKLYTILRPRRSEKIPVVYEVGGPQNVPRWSYFSCHSVFEAHLKYLWLDRSDLTFLQK